MLMEKVIDNIIAVHMFDETEERDRPLVVACKDFENTKDERWVFVALTVGAAKEMYDYLGKYFTN